MSNTIIILLGRCCKIVCAMQKINLKHKSGLFDWVESNNFEDILYCINKLSQNEDLTITYERPGFPGNIFIDNTDIRTSHYTFEEYEKILKRRSDRFIEYIKGNNPILFIREDLVYFTTQEQLIEFKKIIYKINPDCEFNFLLLSPEKNYTKIIEDKIFCEINYEEKYENYINLICKDKLPLKSINSINI